MSDLLWPRRKNYKETNTFQNGIERGQMTLVVMKINHSTSGGKQGNFNYIGRTLLYEDKENSVENFEKEYLGFTVQTVIM
jgi:hypothetical protein